ncbi:MAG TPA: DASS family sodium-coupled anion symporter [Gemmatimonadota bacterium]|nr:DASS family sodium-coupled anion symporter [Gemmatimonadota bacterium]
MRGQVGLVAAPLAFLLVLALPRPAELDLAAWRTAACAVAMAILWITEAIPIPATGLLPLALFPLLGIGSIEETGPPYANPIIFLFLGGFLLAASMERWGLHRRLALTIIRRLGTAPRRLVAGFLASAAFLSMWISNTAATLLLLPIGLSVLELGDPAREGRTEAHEAGDLAPALVLAIAFGAGIGGVATLIGTPPNALTAAFLLETYGMRIGFARWMAIGVPLALVALPLTYLVLVRIAFRVGGGEIPGGRALIEREIASLGRMSRGEAIVATTFLLAACGWIARPMLQGWIPGLSDAGIAMLAALALFLTPVSWRPREFALDWSSAQRIPWGVIILFGGGLALADAIERTGLSAWLAGGFESFGGWPLAAIVVLVALVVILFSELASNTATAATMLPVVGALALATGLSPLPLVIGAGLAASGGYMLPVATPPNAIAYGTGRVTVPQLARAGALLDLAFLLLVSAVATLLVPLVLGI